MAGLVFGFPPVSGSVGAGLGGTGFGLGFTTGFGFGVAFVVVPATAGAGAGAAELLATATLDTAVLDGVLTACFDDVQADRIKTGTASAAITRAERMPHRKGAEGVAGG